MWPTQCPRATGFAMLCDLYLAVWDDRFFIEMTGILFICEPEEGSIATVYINVSFLDNGLLLKLNTSHPHALVSCPRCAIAPAQNSTDLHGEGKGLIGRPAVTRCLRTTLLDFNCTVTGGEKNKRVRPRPRSKGKMLQKWETKNEASRKTALRWT